MIKSSHEALITIDEEANMTREKVKMDQVKEENERLKLTLSQMMKDYHSLQMQLNDQSNKPTNLATMASSDNESELVSLRLGRFSADHCKVEKIKKNNNSSNETKNPDGIELGLNCGSYSDNSAEDSRTVKPDENSVDESREEESTDVRSSRRSPPKNSRLEDDEDILLQNPVKKPRVSVRAVWNTQTMHDGCQWRKYGQKIAKGNPCPRAYYRCTVSSSCPVRKQVQRCKDDMSILSTTYEGSHNHPLPAAATSMASATSAAAAMLSSGSSTSPHISSTSSSLFRINNKYARATISTSQSHPTVILDLTPQNHTNKYSSSMFSAPYSTPTSLNFSSFDPKISSWESKFPTINKVASSPFQQPPMVSNILRQTAVTDDQKIAAATKAITHDPTFQSALAAAITSFVGKNNASPGLNFHLNFSNATVGCAATFMNRFPQPMNSQRKSFTHFAPLALSAPKSQVTSLADEGEQMKL